MRGEQQQTKNTTHSVVAFYTPQTSQGSHHLLDRDYRTSYTSSLPYVQESWETPSVSQDFQAGNIVRDEDWDVRAHNKRVNVSEYIIGEAVVVRCNQHKWLFGTIKRLSARGVRVWVADAQLMVNVPMELLQTHLLKMCVFLELTSLPQSKPMLTMARVDELGRGGGGDGGGGGRALVQCVRPAHLSHRQLYQMMGNNYSICVICREQLPAKDVISPWGCLHLCHFTCLQSQAHHNLTSNCPLCEESATTHQLLVPKSQIPTTSPTTTNISLLEPCVGPPKEGPCTYMWRSIQGMNMSPLPTIACPSCHQSLPNNMVMPTTTSQGALGPLELKVNAQFKGDDHVSSLILYSSPSSSIDPTSLDHANPSTFIPQEEEGDVVGTIVVYSSPSGLASQPISLPIRLQAIEEVPKVLLQSSSSNINELEGRRHQGMEKGSQFNKELEASKLGPLLPQPTFVNHFPLFSNLAQNASSSSSSSGIFAKMNGEDLGTLKNSNELAPVWVTVIKDGQDARNLLTRKKELEQIVKVKELEFTHN